jgi:hypothetical protein
MMDADVEGGARRGNGMVRDTGRPALKPYTKPEVVMLGNLASLTKITGGTTGANDMGGGKDKTGF